MLKTAKMPKTTYTVKDVARLLDFSTNTVYKYIDDGSIKAVRLGKEGRFRIPSAEVERLLQERGKGSLVETSPIVQGIKETKIHIKGSPSLFDWFVCFVSISLGFSLLIFPASPALRLALDFTVLTVPLQILLIVGGFLILILDVFRFRNVPWRRWVYVSMAIVYASMAFIFGSVGGMALTIAYFAIAVAVIANVFINISEYSKYILFMILFLILFGASFLIWPNEFSVAKIFPVNNRNMLFFFFGWLATVFICLKGFTELKNHPKIIWLFAIPTALASLAYGTFAFTQGLWSRTIFFVVLSSFSIMFPFAYKFENFTLRSKKEAIGSFSWLLGLFLIGFIMLSCVYRSFQIFSLGELTRRVNTASDIVSDFLDGNVAKISTFAADAELITAMKNYNADNVILANYNLRQLYQVANWTIGRVILVNNNGLILDTYPFNPTSQNVNIGERDYFREPKVSGTTYISDIIQPSSPGIPPVVLISVPIFDGNNVFLGVVIGSVDINELTKRINQVRFGESGTYLLMDKNGNYIIPPTPDKVMTKADPGSYALMTVLGQSGTAQVSDSQNVLSLIAYRPIDKYRWGIVAQQPVVEALAPYSKTVFLIFVVFIASGIGSLVLVFSMRKGAIK